MTTEPVPELPDWVKVGATGEVKRWAGSAPNGRRITTVERMTPTLIITADGERYRKISYRAYRSGAHFQTNRRGGLYWSEITIPKPED